MDHFDGRWTLSQICPPYLSLFLPPKSLFILSNTELRGIGIFGLLPLTESWDITWTIIQSTIFLSFNLLIQSVIPSFTVLLNSSGSCGCWDINAWVHLIWIMILTVIAVITFALTGKHSFVCVCLCIISSYCTVIYRLIVFYNSIYGLGAKQDGHETRGHNLKYGMRKKKRWVRCLSHLLETE